MAPAAKCAQGHRGFQTPKGQFITQVWRSLYTASQQQNRRWSLPVLLENPWPQPAATLKWLKSISSTASLSQGLEKPVWMGYSSLQTREKSSSLEPGEGASLPSCSQSDVQLLCYIALLKEEKSPLLCWHRCLSPLWVGPQPEFCWELLALIRLKIGGQKIFFLSFTK